MLGSWGYWDSGRRAETVDTVYTAIDGQTWTEFVQEVYGLEILTSDRDTLI